MATTREICKICGRVNPVGFTVPDDMWREAVPSYHHASVVCLPCFIHLADEKLLSWDRDIHFFPVSLFTHLATNAEELRDL